MREQKKHILLYAFLLLTINAFSQARTITQSTWSQRWGYEQTVGVHVYDMQFPVFGVDSVGAEWFGLCLHSGSLMQYLDKQSDYVNFFTDASGLANDAQVHYMSVMGNSYRMNRFYLDGFRIDSRVLPGVSFYRPNMCYNNLTIDTYQSKFEINRVANDDANFYSLAGDVGGSFGGPDPGAFAPRSAYQLYPENRSFTLGHLQGEIQYNHEDKQTIHYYRTFRHRAVFDIGYNQYAAWDGNDIGRNRKITYHVELNGELAIPTKRRKIERRDMVRMYYLLNATRQNMGHQFGYNLDEQYTLDYYSLSVYFKSPEWNMNKYRLYGERHPVWTMGVTYALAYVSGLDNYHRNSFDADGLAYAPWMQPGLNHEVSFSAKLKFDITSWLRLHYEGYNSFVAVTPNIRKDNVWNTYSFPGTLESTPLYTIRWQNENMFGLLLENSLGLEAHYRRTKRFGMKAQVDGTFDGIVYFNQTPIVKPNWQAQLSFDWRPLRVLEIGLTIANFRIPFTMDDMRFLSKNHQNGTIYIYDREYSTTGGAYHSIDSKILQPQYIVVDLPIKFAPGRHEISFNTQVKKFYNHWTVNYDGVAENYGSYENGVFYPKSGVKQYVVDYQPLQSDNYLTNSPYFISNILKYAYNGKFFYLSASLNTTVFQGTSIGNGFWASDISTLSELSANPNNKVFVEGNNAVHQLLPVYTARLMMAYNPTNQWHFGVAVKYQSGNTWSKYKVSYTANEEITYQRSNAGGASLLEVADLFTQKNKESWTDPTIDIDMNISYRWKTRKYKRIYEIKLEAYNLYDFASRLAGNAYDDGKGYILTQPRGLVVSLKSSL